jgi:hypothetical protein
MISALVSLPVQLCVASVFLGLGVWLGFLTFNNHKDD